MYDMARGNSSKPFSHSENTAYLLAFSEKNLTGFIGLKLEKDLAIISIVATHEDYNDQKLRFKLVRAALLLSVKKDCHRVQVACQEPSIPFFKQLGFHIAKSSLHEHDGLVYSLENPCPEYFLHAQGQQKDPQKRTQTLILNEDAETHNFSEESQYRQLHHSMLIQARKQIWLLMNTATNPILNDEYTSACILRLIKRNPQSEIRLLLANDKTGAGYYNPTINLAQRLSSHIEIRTLNKTGMPFKEMITLVDYSACIYRRSLASQAGFANFYNPLITTRLRNNFEHHWAFSKPSVQLRRLVI